MKKKLQDLLAYLAKQIVKKYNPTVIGITGSIGKTSAKEAIFCVVSQKYRTRRSEKNFNNEFGLPFTILGVKTPGRNLFKWLGTFIKSLALIIFPMAYPQVLILEMGVDRPGDMDYLLSIVRPNIAVITNIGLSHYEYFKDAITLENEKGKLAQGLLPGGTLVVNADNVQALDQRLKTKEKVLSYGTADNADIKFFDIKENIESPLNGVSTRFSIKTPSKNLSSSTRTLGIPHISSIASAVAVGEALNMEAELILKGIKAYKPVPGRLNIIAGIKKTVIIDDTYNSAPDSTRAALELLSRFPGSEKVAILGDMLELGSLSDQKHLEVGKIAASLGLKRLITVGAQGKTIADGAKAAGMSDDKILSFDLSAASLDAVQNLLNPGAVVLIKGSQGMRMEKITKEIMAEPMRATELLSRQDGKWINS